MKNGFLFYVCLLYGILSGYLAFRIHGSDIIRDLTTITTSDNRTIGWHGWFIDLMWYVWDLEA